jgi:hypothetical protein
VTVRAQVRQRVISISEVEETVMMELILGNQTLNSGCTDFGVKEGGDSEDQIREPQIREPWMMLAFKDVLSSIAQ